jgi:hypothetical protein
MSLRLDKGMQARLERAAKQVNMASRTLAQEAIHAAIKAIEANDDRLVVPIAFRIDFQVTHVPTPGKYPPPGPGSMGHLMNEGDEKGKSSGTN